MRKLIIPLTTMLWLLWAVPSRAAQTDSLPPQCRADGSGSQDVSVDPVCLAGHSSGAAGFVPVSGAGGGGASRFSSGPRTTYVPYDRLGIGPDGQGCVTTGYAPEGTTPSDRVRTDLVTQNILDTHGLPLEYPPCPEQPRAPGELAPAETPSMIARRYWERIPLPRPRPTIAPGRAITGKLAFLETRGEVAHTYTTDTAFGPLEIVARGAYAVDWGDGETSGPHSFEGKPWPHGQITHDYLNVGSYDIVVTERWTANWRLGGESGVLRTLQTTGRIEDFPVEQLQAVIVR